MADEGGDRARADEFHGRQALKQTTQASYEEFLPDSLAAGKTDADLRDPSLYINRELSMLDFFERVLVEARDANNPLLERVKFVGIVGSILGEFFMVRIAGLRQQVDAGVTEVSADGHTPQQLLPILQERAWGIMKDARRCFAELLPELDAAGVHILDYEQLAADQRAALDEYYRDAGLPGAHAARLRPGPAVPAHLQPEPQPRRAHPRPERRGALRARQGAAVAAAARAGGGAGGRRGAPEAASLPAGASEAWFTWLEQIVAAHLGHAVPRHGDRRVLPVPRHARRRDRHPGAGGRRPARDHRARSCAAGASARWSASRWTRPCRSASAASSARTWSSAPRDLYEVQVAARAEQPVGRGQRRSSRPQVRPPGPGGAARRSTASRAATSSPPSASATSCCTTRTTRSSPWWSSCAPAADDPDVLAIKQTLYRVGRNAPVVEALHGGRRQRQAGRRAGRAQGALRRGEQHRLGARRWSARACTWSTASSA